MFQIVGHRLVFLVSQGMSSTRALISSNFRIRHALSSLPTYFPSSGESVALLHRRNLFATKNDNSFFYFTMQQQRCFSNEGGIFGRIRGYLDTRREEKKSDKIIKQIETMASLEAWTLKSYLNEIDSSLGDWTTKIPGMGNMKSTKALNESKRILSAFIEELGENAKAEDLVNMDRKQKLKISIKGEVAIEEINLIMQQFRSMALMHRVLRYRKENGKPLPTDEASMQLAMTEDSQHVVSRQEKKEMRDEMTKRKVTKNMRR